MMKHSLVRILLASAAAVFLIAGCASNSGPKDSTMNYWDKKKGDCDEVLKSPQAYDLSRISYCTKMWETYRYVDNLTTKDRSMYAVAFSIVSHKSTDPYDRGIADAALTRVCIPRHPLDSSGQVREEIPDSLECNAQVSDIKIAGQSISSGSRFTQIKKSVQIGEVSDKDYKASNAAYKRGMEQRQKKAYGKAIASYKEALVYNPYNVSAKYDLASVLAIEGDSAGALRQLEELYSWDDYEAERRLEEARTSADFENIRDDANFKQMTGYVRIVLLNGAGGLGEPKIESIRKKLEAKSIPVAEVTRSNEPQVQPQIWYREGFEDYAYRIKDLMRVAVGARNVSVKAMKGNDLNDDIYHNDIRVIWGQHEALSEFGLDQDKPVVTGDRAKGSGNKLDDLVKEADKAKSTVDHTKQFGEGIKNLTK
ncbi:MAG: hypothetical protein IJM59_08515 [Proteobacteria bacterium]|nr:hypothetical protein [Pseudomonadota bacterium]